MQCITSLPQLLEAKLDYLKCVGVRSEHELPLLEAPLNCHQSLLGHCSLLQDPLALLGWCDDSHYRILSEGGRSKPAGARRRSASSSCWRPFGVDCDMFRG